MATKKHIPYTYLIGWSNLNKWYYGVRYARGCSPDDLWVKYKTSSNYVKDFVREHGDPDIIQVRKTFDNVSNARLWEEKVLVRMNVIKNEKWINKNNSRSIDPACVPRGEQHWTFNNESHRVRMTGENNHMKLKDVKNKVAGDNHYSRQSEWDNSNHAMKRPEVRAKQSVSVSGDNHYTHKEGYDNSNHYSKRPEAKLKRAELNKQMFTGFKHRMKSCPGCQREIAANNYPQHLKKCKLFTDLVDSNK